MEPGVELAGTVCPTVGVSTLRPTGALAASMIAGPLASGTSGEADGAPGLSGSGVRVSSQTAPAAAHTIRASTASSTTNLRLPPGRAAGTGSAAPYGGGGGDGGGGPARCERSGSGATPTVDTAPRSS